MKSQQIDLQGLLGLREHSVVKCLKNILITREGITADDESMLGASWGNVSGSIFCFV